MTDFTKYVVTARISINAMSEREATEIIAEALADRIDGHLLEPQRQARLVSVEPESALEERLEIAHEAYELAAENLNKVIDRSKFYREYLIHEPSYMRRSK